MLTLPETSVQNECSFSRMKLLKGGNFKKRQQRDYAIFPAGWSLAALTIGVVVVH